MCNIPKGTFSSLFASSYLRIQESKRGMCWCHLGNDSGKLPARQTQDMSPDQYPGLGNPLLNLP